MPMGSSTEMVSFSDVVLRVFYTLFSLTRFVPFCHYFSPIQTKVKPDNIGFYFKPDALSRVDEECEGIPKRQCALAIYIFFFRNVVVNSLASYYTVPTYISILSV